ncbi:MAG: hypothetical protein Q4C56_10135, partial [Peptococcaceae bacterium]|nr:hypothetical protein [Peptococcaceae bacterium]
QEAIIAQGWTVAKTRLQGLSAQEWTRGAQKLTGEISLPQEAHVYEKIWQQGLAPLYQRVPQMLLAFSEEISRFASRLLMARLSLPKQLGFKMAGGRHLIEKVLVYFFEEKLPDYMQAKAGDASTLFHEWAMQALAGQSLANLGMNISTQEGRWLVLQAARLELVDVPALAAMLETQLAQIPEKQATHIERGGARMAMQLLSKGEAPFVQQLLRQLNMRAILDQSEAFGTALCQKLLTQGSLDTLLSLETGGAWQKVRDLLTFDEEEKVAIVQLGTGFQNVVGPAFWAYMLHEGRQLVMLIDVPGITARQICALSPEALEVMVRGIAQPYFKRVERMGWMGAVVALPATALSMMLGGF